jgi:hypothetical protein
MSRFRGNSSGFRQKALLAAAIILCPLSQMVGQTITFYPDVDSLALWGTCTPPGFTWRSVRVSSGFDRILIIPYTCELIRGTPPNHIVARYDSAFFTTTDSLHLNRYELWYTSFSQFHAGRWRIPQDSVTWVFPGLISMTLVVLRDSVIVDSSRVTWSSYQTGLGVSDGLREVPMNVYLYQNYPNPFNPSTTIKFELPKSSEVKLSVYDLLGREVSALVNERKTPGSYEVMFDASGLSSGVYLYRLTSGSLVEARKLLLLK